MSCIETEDAGSEAGAFAETEIRKLMPWLLALKASPIARDDAETMNAAARGIGYYLSSVLWQRRHLAEFGGLVSTPPGEEAVAEREALRAEILHMLGDEKLSLPLFFLAAVALGLLMYAEYDGQMQPARDIASLGVIRRSWNDLGKITVEGGAGLLLKFLANTAISLTAADAKDEAARTAALAINEMVRDIDLSSTPIDEKIANMVIDFVGALVLFELKDPNHPVSTIAAWDTLRDASWHARVIEKVSWLRLCELLLTAMPMLKQDANQDRQRAWSWLEAQLTSPPDINLHEADWAVIGHILAEAICDDHLDTRRAMALISGLRSKIESADFPSAVGDGLCTLATRVPVSRPLNAHDPDFVLGALENGLLESNQSTWRIQAIVSLLIQYALDDDWNTVERTLDRFMDDDAETAWVGRVVAYRTIAELALFSALPPDRVRAFVKALVMPFPVTGEAAAVEEARRTAIANLFLNDDLDVHPVTFFPLLGLADHE